MRRLQLASVFVSLFLVAAALPANADDYSHGGITVSAPWARATPPAARTGAVYASIRNSGDAPDRLIGIETEMAARGEIHQMSIEGGVMRMRPLGEGLLVAPGATVALAPGGLHVMLTGLKKPLRTGEAFAATAVFETAGRIEVKVAVVAMGAPPPGGHMMEMPQGGSKP